MSSLLDQTALAELAERLVAAARRAGADQADAVAVRSVSLSVDVRDRAVEESQRAEGDDVGFGGEIGLVGSSGRTSGTHLHYEVLVDGRPRNPLTFLRATADVRKNR